MRDPNYNNLDAKLGHKSSMKLENNTRLVRLANGDLAVRLHETDILTYKPNGDVIYNSGGWLTATTKDRMVTWGPVQMWQEKKVWYVRVPGPAGTRARYVDGMVVRDGWPQLPPEQETDAKKLRRLERAIRTYVDNYVVHIMEHGFTEPGEGDCWACWFTLQQAWAKLEQRPIERVIEEGEAWKEPETPAVELVMGEEAVQNRPGTPNGEVFGFEHYLHHIRQRYYVPSLLVNALLARGQYAPAYVLQRLREDRDSRDLEQALRSFFSRIKPNLLPHLALLDAEQPTE